MKQQFGAVLYFTSSDESLMSLRKLLERSIGSLVGVQFRYYKTILTSPYHISRKRLLKQAQLDDIIELISSKSSDTILIFDKDRPDDLSSDEPQVSILINFDDLLPFNRLVLHTSRSSFVQKETLADLCQLSIDFNAFYGCMLVGPLFLVDAVLQHVPHTSKGMRDRDGKLIHKIHYQNEIFYYQSHYRSLFPNYIPRADWGNLLNPIHVAALGGEDKIREESGCYLVERWGQNLFLQLTESPWNVTKEQLRELNHYLEPIRIPGAPEPVYV